MKFVVGIAAFVIALAMVVGPANAQLTSPDGTGHGSCYQVPTTEPSAGTPTVIFGGLGWNLFLSSHANRLILALSRWQPTPGTALVPARVRMPSAGSRVTR